MRYGFVYFGHTLADTFSYKLTHTRAKCPYLWPSFLRVFVRVYACSTYYVLRLVFVPHAVLKKDVWIRNFRDPDPGSNVAACKAVYVGVYSKIHTCDGKCAPRDRIIDAQRKTSAPTEKQRTWRMPAAPLNWSVCTTEHRIGTAQHYTHAPPIYPRIVRGDLHERAHGNAVALSHIVCFMTVSRAVDLHLILRKLRMYVW